MARRGRWAALLRGMVGWVRPADPRRSDATIAYLHRWPTGNRDHLDQILSSSASRVSCTRSWRPPSALCWRMSWSSAGHERACSPAMAVLDGVMAPIEPGPGRDNRNNFDAGSQEGNPERDAERRSERGAGAAPRSEIGEAGRRGAIWVSWRRRLTAARSWSTSFMLLSNSRPRRTTVRTICGDERNTRSIATCYGMSQVAWSG